MRLADLVSLAWRNVRRNRTRSLLTGAGVMIGAAALYTLLAYGSGLEQTVQQEVDALKLQNTLRVTSHPIPGLTDRRAAPNPGQTPAAVALTDSLVRAFEQIDGVLAAYPELQFPAKLDGNGQALPVTAEGIPMAFQHIAAYQPADGRFFETGEEAAILISRSMAQRLGYQPVDAAVGQTIDLVTASLNFYKLRTEAESFGSGLRTLPMSRRPYDVRIAGLLDNAGQPVSGLTRVLLPLPFGQSLNKVPFFSTLDLLFRHSRTQEGYAAVRVQMHDDADPVAVRRALDAAGVYTTSFRRQFERLDTLFLILDLSLGFIGVIALAVAVLGIANTVMMSVRERTREIGIMMAMGGNARDLQRLFVVESGALGALGGGAGLALGGGLAIALNEGLNAYLSTLGVPPITLFDLSVGTALAIWGGAVLVSILAGVLPARRAAQVEPTEALRT